MLPNPNLKGKVSVNGVPLDEYIERFVGGKRGPADSSPASSSHDDKDLIMPTLQEIMSESKATKDQVNDLGKKVAETTALDATKVSALEAQITALEKKLPLLEKDENALKEVSLKFTALEKKISLLEKKLEAVQKQTADLKPKRGADLDTVVTQLRKEISQVRDEVQKGVKS